MPSGLRRGAWNAGTRITNRVPLERFSRLPSAHLEIGRSRRAHGWRPGSWAARARHGTLKELSQWRRSSALRPVEQSERGRTNPRPGVKLRPGRRTSRSGPSSSETLSPTNPYGRLEPFLRVSLRNRFEAFAGPGEADKSAAARRTRPASRARPELVGAGFHAAVFLIHSLLSERSRGAWSVALIRKRSR